MQAYIIKKGGVIDCWPDANSVSTFDFYNIRKDDERNIATKVGINYFAPKIQEKAIRSELIITVRTSLFTEMRVPASTPRIL